MKFTGLDVFDVTIQRTNAWLKDLMQELNWSDRRQTYLAFRCVLHAIRDHIALKDAVFLGEQLPMLIRGAYFEHWTPPDRPPLLRSQEDFFSILSCSLARDGEHAANAKAVTLAVFRLLERKATEGEIEDLQHVMPQALSDLWPPTLRAA
jgi:uncharacterized protein (DUF2267 family)